MIVVRNKSIYYAILYIFIIFSLTLKDFYHIYNNVLLILFY